MNLPKFSHSPDRKIRKILTRLQKELAECYRVMIIETGRGTRRTEQVKSMLGTALLYSQLMTALEEMLEEDEKPTGLEAGGVLRKYTGEFTQNLSSLAGDSHKSRRGILSAINLLSVAEEGINDLLDQNPTNLPRKILIHTDLLLQGFHSLFPAERMGVVAGRRGANGVVTLGALFDVTGVSSAGHVRANPETLGQALIAMELTGTHLAAWFHSHPSHGVSATQPSTTDLTQHQDWIHDYSPALLSGIFVQDGWLRLWGSGLENRLIDVEFAGNGIVKEGQNEWVYHLHPG
jgi:proteasome lid subunit RPN8/RPN11